MKILVTGAAGFIGMHVAQRMLLAGHEVRGLDNLNEYYDVRLKHYRLAILQKNKKFDFIKLDLKNREAVAKLFDQERYDVVIHLAAQAGVRHSLDAPFEYVDSNLVGFMAILEGVRKQNCQNFIYASSSSVYGANSKVPFKEDDRSDEPVSLYAATKKANELMAHSYASLYKIPTTGLRFFTVYGPAGRPDMAPWLFTEAILSDEPIRVFNNGEMFRDFTYIDDIVDGVEQVMELVPSGSNLHRVLNIGNGSPVPLMDFIGAIENALDKKARKIFVSMQPGDVPRTFASTKKLQSLSGYEPGTKLADGVAKFVAWYVEKWLPYSKSQIS